MNTSDAKTAGFSSGEEDSPLYFSEWLKCRRQALDLTQEQLAQRASCSVFALRKIESGERQPSRQLARALAQALDLPSEKQDLFIQAARGELSMERLASVAHTTLQDSDPVVQSSPLPIHLPRALTPFIGREPELSALGGLLCDPQCLLLTIVGPGGIGKTRLAVEAADQYKDRFPDGVWFVPLSELNSPALLVPAIAGALHFRFQDSTDPQPQLLRYLSGKKSLLILDNAEHLLEGVGLFTAILQACPDVKLLVTSRERLNLLSEWVFDITGLPVPPGDGVELFESYSSVALFLQSARRACPSFVLEETDRAGITSICRLVEGMPLAIELAAVWICTLSLSEIEQEIQRNLDFLSTTMRDLPERHRSMRAVFEHSWNLLSEQEQQALSRLSVFRGGFTREAAEQVAGTSLSSISTLVNHTLLRRTAHGRYDLHELVRQYSAGRLATDPEMNSATQKRHHAYFLALAEASDQELKGSNQLDWLERLEADYSNLRAALEWSLKSGCAGPGDDSALRLAGALRWFWRMRGHFHEGRDWLIQALKTCPKRYTTARAYAQLGLSMLMNILGDLGAAGPQAEESAAIFRKLGNQQGLAEVLSEAGATFVWQGEATLAFARFEEALALFRQAGNRWGEAQVLYRLGDTLVDYRCDSVGKDMLEESAKILEELGEKYLYVYVLISLGAIEIQVGNYTSARTHLERGLAVATEIKHPSGVADSLTSLGDVCRIQGDYLTAHSQLEAAYQVHQEAGSSIWETGVLCFLAENEIAQGNLSAAQLYILAASNYLKLPENKLANTLVCHFRGLLAYYQGDAEEAAELLEESLALARKGIYRPEVGRSLIALARARRALGQIVQATNLALEALELYEKYGRKLGTAIALEELAAVCIVQRDTARAVMLFSVANTLRKRLGAPLPPVDRASHDSALALCNTQLGETVCAAIWADASTRHFQEVVEEILKNKSVFCGA